MKILKILNNLNENQLLAIPDFLNSPYFKISEEVANHYRIFHSVIQQNRLHETSAKELFEASNSVDPEITKPKFNALNNKLKKAIDLFLTFDNFKNNELDRSFSLLDSYSKFSDSTFYHNEYEKYHSSLESRPQKGVDYYLQLNRLYSDKYFHPSTVKNSLEAGTLLFEAQTAFNKAYLLSQLFTATELKSRSKKVTEHYEIAHLETALALAKDLEDPVFTFAVNLYELQGKNPPKYLFSDTVDWFLKNAHQLHPSKQGIALIMLSNLANDRYSKGDPNAIHTVFELNKIGMEQGLLFDQSGRMAAICFTNNVVTACLCKDFKYAKFHINTYQDKLYPEIETVAVAIAEAFILFHQGHHADAWKKIGTVELKSIPLTLQARTLLIRCYYEDLKVNSSIATPLTTELSTFWKYIYRLRPSYDGYKDQYYKMIRAIRYLLKLVPYHRDFSKHSDELNAFINARPIVARSWLLEKLQEKKDESQQNK